MWYPAIDQMDGTETFGVQTNDMDFWGIAFNTLTYDEILFTTNNFEHWIIMSAATFTPAN